MPEGEQESLATGNFIPPVDVYEDANQLVMKLEVPGIKQEDLDVRVENQTLMVKGERKFEKNEKEENIISILLTNQNLDRGASLTRPRG